MDKEPRFARSKVDNIVTGAAIGTVLMGILNIIVALIIKLGISLEQVLPGVHYANVTLTVIYVGMYVITSGALIVLAIFYPIDHQNTQQVTHGGVYIMELCIVVAAILSVYTVFNTGTTGHANLLLPFAHLALFIIGILSASLLHPSNS